MVLRYLDFVDKAAYFSVKADGRQATKNENGPAYTMVTFGNMSYMADGLIQSNIPSKVHMLVGNYCQIAHSTTFEMAMNHAFSGITAYPFDQLLGSSKDDIARRSMANKRQLIIGHDVWIGSGVRIIKALKIGNGAIIGSGSVVTKDVPPYAIVGGNPAKIIRYRFSPETIEALDKIKWWYWPVERITANRQYMNSLENVEKFIEMFGEERTNTKCEVSLQSNKKSETSELLAKAYSTNGVIDTNNSAFQRKANIAKNAVNKIDILQTLVPPHIQEKFQACHKSGSKIFYFVPDLTASEEDAVWPSVIGQFCKKYGNQPHCLLLALKKDGSNPQEQIRLLQKFMEQFPDRPSPVFFSSPDGIVLELLKWADFFITTRDAISSKGIDYVETFGGHMLSGLEYDIYADIET